MDRHPKAHLLDPYRVKRPTGLKGVPRPRDARQRCFELAGRFVLRQNNPSILVVHGFAFGVAHAWAELPDDIVYDGTCKGFYSASDYARIAQATPIRKMAVGELVEVCMAADGVWCPCPELAAFS